MDAAVASSCSRWRAEEAAAESPDGGQKNLFGTHGAGQAQHQCFGQEARPWERWITDPGVSVPVVRTLPRGPVHPKHS